MVLRSRALRALKELRYKTCITDNPNPIIAQPSAVPIGTAGLVSYLLGSKSLQQKGDLAAVRTANVRERSTITKINYPSEKFWL